MGNTMNVLNCPASWIFWFGILAAFVSFGEASINPGITDLFTVHDENLFDDTRGIIAAFGDFNADDRPDIFIITNNSQGVSVLLAGEGKPDNKFLLSVDTSVIISVVPTDFNGDAQMDIMIITRDVMNKTGPYQASIYWGNRTANDVYPVPLVLSEKFEGEPLVFDYNADMLPDLLAEPAGHPGVRKVWIANITKTFSIIDFPEAFESEDPSPFLPSQSHAFIDLNNDLAADLVLVTKQGYEIWMNEDGAFKFNTTRAFPGNLADGVIGQSSFSDVDSNQYMDQIVPVCLDEDCAQSAIYIHDILTNKWDRCMGPSDFNMSGQIWTFVSPDQNYLNQSFQVMLRVGDYNLDGYSDGVAVLRGKDEHGAAVQRLVLFENVACKENSCVFPRTFSLQYDDHYADINKGVVVGTFLDIFEDGLPDLVFVSMTETNGVTQPLVSMIKNTVAEDDCFIKITVVSGLCGSQCQDKSKPYGVNYPGVAVTFSTTRTDGQPETCYGTQLPQTAHFALMTPYQSFGLGPTPNFLDTLTVGIPTPPNEDFREKSFSFIIPNSQLVVIPHPPNSPSSWKMKLFVTPSHAIVMTGVALLGTCVFVAAITGILHWRERREDFLEKKQEAQRFHFDAM